MSAPWVEVWVLTVEGDYDTDSYVFATEQELKDFLVDEYQYDFDDEGEFENVPAFWDPVHLPLARLKVIDK